MILYNSKERFEDCIDDKYINRCWLYLRPSLMLLKSRNELLKIKSQMVGCSIDNNALLLFLKLKPSNASLQDAINALKFNNELIDEYIFSKTLHVIKISPDINYDAFLEGAYSRIYTAEQINICFPFPGKVKSILTKDADYKSKYITFIQECFGNDIREDSLTEHSEYDIPPCLNQEKIHGYKDI